MHLKYKSILTSLTLFSIYGSAHADSASFLAPISQAKDPVIATIPAPVVAEAQTDETTLLSSKIDYSSEHKSDKNTYEKCQSKSPSASKEQGLILEGAWLYWQAQEAGLEYAERVTAAIDLADSRINALGVLKELDFDWHSGFQVGAGYIFPQRQQWDVSVMWTRLNSKAHASSTVTDYDASFNNLKPIWNSLITGTVADSASAKWTLHYDTLDGMLARSYYVGRYLTLKPAIGVRGAWINQDYHVKYHAQHIGLALRNNTFKADNDFSGAGLRTACDLRFLLSSNFAIMGSFSGSLIYGTFTINQKTDGELPLEAIGLLERVEMKESNLNQIAPNLEGKLGLQFFNSPSCNKFRFLFGAFYNIGVWWDQNQLTNTAAFLGSGGNSLLTVVRNGGNLQFQGLSLDLRLEF